MNYKFVMIFLSMIFFIGITGCSKDNQISSLNQDISRLRKEKSQLNEKIAELNKQVGIGEKQFLEENNINVMNTSFFFILIIILIIILGYRYISKIKKIHEKEKSELEEKNNISHKLILNLEYEIKQLKHDLEDGEKNEVSNLLKLLKSERELKKQKIGGLDEK